jgi:hypothetical protein
MKYMLFCRNEPVDLGIEDSKGSWDKEKFVEHIRRCRECSRFIGLRGIEALNTLVEAYKTEKGGHSFDRPQNLNPQERRKRKK